jgi:hypothetical protein
MGKEKRKNRKSSNVHGTSVEKALLENFISLQRVLVNLSSKFDNLANEISKLLELFEISAKALAEKNFAISGDKGNEKIIQKIDTLLDQNKTIAKGLTLMHELNTKQMPKPAYSPNFSPSPANSSIVKNASPEGYQKSIASEENSSDSFETPISPQERKFKKLPGG